MTDRRRNATQLTLDAGWAERAFACHLNAVEVRESIRPLERRRMHGLAALVALTPCCRRADRD